MGVLGLLLRRASVVSRAATGRLDEGRVEEMLWTIIVILVILWLLGFIGHFGGGLIHILIVIAVIILIYNLVAGRRG